MNIDDLLANEAQRKRRFPAAEKGIFLAHAAVAPMPRAAREAIAAWCDIASTGSQENKATEAVVQQCRNRAAQLLGADASEISLLGPTSLGLSLVAKGLDWQPGDEVVYHADDYPANVYPWLALADHGVRPVALQPNAPGRITWECVEAALTEKTRLVALASCHFLSGFRIDIEHIGRNLRERGILFCLDAIQTLGAFPFPPHAVDFLSADSHKWLLGPAGAGIFYVRDAVREQLKPALLGSWNVVSPDFIAQREIAFEPGGRRYEPGILNLPGIYGMNASLGVLLEVGIEAIAQRLLTLRAILVDGLAAKGYTLYLEDEPSPQAQAQHQSAIVTFHKNGADLDALGKKLTTAGITFSHRANRHNQKLIRLSPHYYNTQAELEQVLALL